jgi:hypothetical protein
MGGECGLDDSEALTMPHTKLSARKSPAATLHAAGGEASPDTLDRLLGAVASLAHSVVAQIAATAAVTLAVATIPWLHDAAPATAPAPASAPVAGAHAPSMLDLAGIQPVSGFPMEGEERFGIALNRPYHMVADASWSDGTPLQQAQQASMPRVRHRDVDMPIAAESGGSAGLPAVGLMPPERPADLQIATVPPRQRPAEAGLDRTGPEVAARDLSSHNPAASTAEPAATGVLARIASLELPSVPVLSGLPSVQSLPVVGAVSAAIGSKAADARHAMARTVDWAADSISNAVPRL